MSLQVLLRDEESNNWTLDHTIHQSACNHTYARNAGMNVKTVLKAYPLAEESTSHHMLPLAVTSNMWKMHVIVTTHYWWCLFFVKWYMISKYRFGLNVKRKWRPSHPTNLMAVPRTSVQPWLRANRVTWATGGGLVLRCKIMHWGSSMVNGTLWIQGGTPL
jgi:hypothetical protein